MLEVLCHFLAGFELLAALLAKLTEAALGGQPDRGALHQRLNTRLQLLQLLAQRHALFLGVRDAVGQRRDTGFQLLMQSFQIVNIDPLTLTLAEFSQQTFRLLLFAQALFQLVQTHTQRLNLFCQMTLIDAIAQ